MADTSASGGVKYAKQDSSYFAKRGLQRYAGIWSLWALGVGAVISGHFSGWNLGFAYGGWGGMLVAGIIIAIMYLGLTFSIAEMSPALPHTGAAYSFARSSMGPWGGFITGLFENVEYVLTPAVICTFISAYFGSITGLDTALYPVLWIVFYAIFLALNIYGVALSYKVTLAVTLISLAGLAFFYISGIFHMDFNKFALNIATDVQSYAIPLEALRADGVALPVDVAALVAGAPADAADISISVAQYGTLAPELQQVAVGSHELPDGNGPWFPFGFSGVLAALPFAVWLFLAIEQVPLAAEESVDPKRDMPKGIMLGFATLALSAFLVVLVNPSIVGVGSADLAGSLEPALFGIRAMYGDAAAPIFGVVALVGLVASFHTILYAQGRQVYSLSRAGYFPSGLSVTHDKYKTPHVAMIAGSLLGLGVMLVIWFTNGGGGNAPTQLGDDIIGSVLLNMAVFGAMLSYIAQATSFILLRRNLPNIERPFKSPLGIPGAAVTIVIALVTLYYQIQDPNFFKGVIWVVVWCVVGIIYFAVIGRNKLILSPEEEFALEHKNKA